MLNVYKSYIYYKITKQTGFNAYKQQEYVFVTIWTLDTLPLSEKNMYISLVIFNFCFDIKYHILLEIIFLRAQKIDKYKVVRFTSTKHFIKSY